jgi:hypothetical protein
LANQTGVSSIPVFTPTAGGPTTITITPKANGCTGTAVTYTITVNPTPTATAPANQTYCAGVATTAIPLTGTPSGVVFDISGGAAIGLANQTGVSSIPVFTPTAGGPTTITITPKANGCTGTAVTYTITVNSAPVVTLQPSINVICANNQAAIYNADVTGTPTPSVQWQISYDNGATWANIAGATGKSYTFTPGPPDNGQQFRAMFTNSCGTSTTAAAGLSVGNGVNFPI